MEETMDYKKSGVDIKAGEESVNRIKPMVKSTFNKNVLTQIGGFGGLYQVDLAKWKEPVLVSSADGVGTKIMVARMAGIYNTVGQDLVNHCVNDIFVQGAIPQYFLDYIGVGKLKPEIIEEIISGFVLACRENEMALIGGEMAEMPGIYSPEDFDLAGTIVGLVEKSKIITGEKIVEGDVVLGFNSTGLHTNGYSLARAIIFDILKLNVDSILPGLNKTVAEALLAIHKSYLPLLVDFADPEKIHGMAHITGGGIPGNLKRVIPDGLCAVIDSNSWEVPELFKLLVDAGNVDALESFSAFNMGIGYTVVCPERIATDIMRRSSAIKIGVIEQKINADKVNLINI
ncbi:MAG: phosphoribosylformylglycinamidine cyclo-ligase [Candidatus Cloacimonetes bacterium]|nr:phosphoribosylformylglycinamidine cyclo-ligase [Candidatus Cloacimonadota bacterium]